MRKLKLALTLLFAMSFSLFLFACGGGKAVQRIELEGGKTTFTESEDFSADGLTVKVMFKGEKEWETFKAEKGTVDTDKKIIKYADFEVDYSAYQKGVAGEYDIVVTPDPEGQKEADDSITEYVSETYKVTVEHAYGAADANGVEVCSVCQAEREIKIVNETVTTTAWSNKATIEKKGDAELLGVVTPAGENHISYGSIGIGQSARITMTVTTDPAATWNTPLMGIRNGDAGILPREDNYVIGTVAGFSTPVGGTKDAAATAGGYQEALNGAEWVCYGEGTTWNASEYNTPETGATVEIFYNYRTDGVMEIRHTLNPGLGTEKVLTYHIKVPAASYEIVCYGEKAVMNITKVEYVRNLLLLDYTMSHGPNKTVYAENTMFDVAGIQTTASYTRNISSPITSYNLYADIDVTTGEGDAATTETKTVNLRANALVAGMKNFRLEFGGKTIKLEGDNAITVKPSSIDRVYAGEFLYKNTLFSAENAAYAYDVSGEDVAVIVSGKADRLTPAQKTALDTAEDYYIAFRIMAPKSNVLNGNLAAAFDGGTLAGAVIIADNADGALNVILPVNGSTASAVINLSKGGTNLTTAGTVKLDLAGLELPKANYITSTVDSGAMYIDNGGSFKVSYYGIPDDVSKLGISVGSRSKDLESVAKATAEKPVTVGSAKVTAYEKAGDKVTITYSFDAPRLNNAFTPEYVVSLVDDENVVTSNTLRYTFEMSADVVDGYVRVADNVYLKPDGAYLLVVALFTGEDLQANYLSTNVAVNVQNELAQAYNLSIEYGANGFSVSAINVLTGAKSTDIKTTLNGTVNNSDDFDFGAAVVLSASLADLGIRADDVKEVYYFDVPEQNVNTAGDYTFYRVNGDNTITAITIAAKDVPAETELQALQCLQDGYYAHAYKADPAADTIDFYYGGRYSKASGAHTWVADENSTTSWTCSVCHSTKEKIVDGDVTYDVVTSPKSAAQGVVNNDTTADGWWVAEEKSSAITLSGDFNVTYFWKNTDGNYPGDGAIEFADANNQYFAMRTFQCDFNPGPDGSKLCAEGSTATHEFTKNGQKIDAIVGAQEGGWTGDAVVTVRRLGTTLTFLQTLTTESGDVYVAVSTITNFTTDDLTCRVAGNPYWCSDIKVAAGTVVKNVDVNGAASNKQIEAISSAVEHGIAVSFKTTEVLGDWTAQVINTAGMIVTLPNLDPWNNTTDGLFPTACNKFPTDENKVNGGQWDSFIGTSENYVTVSMKAGEGVKYYLNGELKIKYEAREALGNKTVDDFVKVVLQLIASDGFLFAPMNMDTNEDGTPDKCGVTAKDLKVTAAMTAEEVLAMYNSNKVAE